MLEVLQLTPWNGAPQYAANPDVEVRRWHFGPNQAGQIIYLSLEHQQEVHLLMVLMARLKHPTAQACSCRAGLWMLGRCSGWV